MPIEVGYIKNLFGSNAKEKYPNRVPNTSSFKKLRKSAVTPHFTNGYVVLKGNYNYCRYKNKYYFLIKGDPISHEKEKYQYFLVYDFGVNILIKNRVTNILGTVNTHNDPEIIKKHLQTCKPALVNPSKTVFVNFTEKEESWISEIEIEEIKTTLNQFVVSKRQFDLFKNKYKSDEVVRYLKNLDTLYSRRKSIFVFDYLKAENIKNKGGKNKVIEKLNETLESIKKEPSKWNLQKVADTRGLLGGKYCLTRKDKPTIGSGDVSTHYKIEKIDLSTLTDIVPINTNDLTPVTVPNKPLNETTGIFDVFTKIKEEKVWKLCRKSYLPIKSKYNNKNLLRPKGEGYATADEARHGTTEAPQEIKVKGIEKPGFLWGLDRLDSVTIWPRGHLQDYSQSLYGREFGTQDGITPGGETLYSYYYTSAPFPTIADYESPLGKHDRSIAGRLKENTPGYGFLIFQVFKEYNNGRDIEYIGNSEFNRTSYFSGFKKKFIELYHEGNSAEGGANTEDEKLNAIAGATAFSRLQLHLDGFSGLYFAPKCFLYNYAYDQMGGYEDAGFGQMPYVNPNRERIYFYTEYEVAGSIGGKGARAKPEVYMNYENYKNGALEREVALERITYLDDVHLPWTIKKGDYFFSSLEYSWKHFKDTGIGLDGKYERFLHYEQDPSRTVWRRYTVATKDPLIRRLNEFFQTIQEGAWPYVPGYATVRFPFPISHGIMEDMYKDYEKIDLSEILPKNNEITQNNEAGVVVLISNRKGQLEYRLLQSFSKIHRLRDDSNQIIESVDGYTERDIEYYRLTNFGVNTVIVDDKHAESLIPLALYLFYKSQNVPTQIAATESGFTASFLWYTDEEIKYSEDGILLDLVGTNGYAFIFKDVVHLIVKETEKSVHTIQIGEFYKRKKHFLKLEDLKDSNDLRKLDIVELVNQKNTLNIYTQPYLLEKKFEFKESDSIDIFIKSSQPSELDSNFVGNLIYVTTGVDSIVEWLPTTKTPNEKIISIPDRIARERLTLEAIRNYENLNIDRSVLDLQREKQKTAFDRAIADLDFANKSKAVDLTFGTVGQLLGSVVPGGLARQGMKEVKGIKNIKIRDVQDKITMDNIEADGFHSRTGSNYSTPARVMGIGRGFNMLGNLITGSMQLSRGNELTNRIKEDRDYTARDVLVKSNQIDLSFLRKKQDLLLEMNSLSNQYHKQSINQISLQMEFNKINNLLSKFIKVQIPSEDEMKILKKYTDEFGIDCFIENIDLKIFSGMSPVIIKYSYIDKASDYGEITELEKEGLEDKLVITGVRIVDLDEKPSGTVQGVYHLIETEKEILSNEVSELKEQIEVLVEEKGDLNSKLSVSQHTLDDLQRKNEEIEKNIANKDEEIKRLNQELQKCLEGDEASKEEVKQRLLGRLQELERELEECKQRPSGGGAVMIPNRDCQHLTSDVLTVPKLKEYLRTPILPPGKRIEDIRDRSEVIDPKEPLIKFVKELLLDPEVSGGMMHYLPGMSEEGKDVQGILGPKAGIKEGAEKLIKGNKDHSGEGITEEDKKKVEDAFNSVSGLIQWIFSGKPQEGVAEGGLDIGRNRDKLRELEKKIDKEEEERKAKEREEHLKRTSIYHCNEERERLEKQLEEEVKKNEEAAALLIKKDEDIAKLGQELEESKKVHGYKKTQLIEYKKCIIQELRKRIKEIFEFCFGYQGDENTEVLKNFYDATTGKGANKYYYWPAIHREVVIADSRPYGDLLKNGLVAANEFLQILNLFIFNKTTSASGKLSSNKFDNKNTNTQLDLESFEGFVNKACVIPTPETGEIDPTESDEYKELYESMKTQVDSKNETIAELTKHNEDATKLLQKKDEDIARLGQELEESKKQVPEQVDIKETEEYRNLLSRLEIAQQQHHQLSESYRQKESELLQQKNLSNLYREEKEKLAKDKADLTTDKQALSDRLYILQQKEIAEKRCPTSAEYQATSYELDMTEWNEKFNINNHFGLTPEKFNDYSGLLIACYFRQHRAGADDNTRKLANVGLRAIVEDAIKNDQYRMSALLDVPSIQGETIQPVNGNTMLKNSLMFANGIKSTIPQNVSSEKNKQKKPKTAMKDAFMRVVNHIQGLQEGDLNDQQKMINLGEKLDRFLVSMQQAPISFNVGDEYKERAQWLSKNKVGANYQPPEGKVVTGR